MKALVGFLLASVLAFGCGAPSAEEEEGLASEDAISGSPSEERAKQEHAYSDKVTAAYRTAPLEAFAELPGGKGLLAESASDYSVMRSRCMPANGYTVNAYRWSVTTVASPANKALVARKLLTVDAFNAKNKKAMFVGIYEESGKLIVGQRYWEQAGIFKDETAADYRKVLSACAPPQY